MSGSPFQLPLMLDVGPGPLGQVIDFRWVELQGKGPGSRMLEMRVHDMMVIVRMRLPKGALQGADTGVKSVTALRILRERP